MHLPDTLTLRVFCGSILFFSDAENRNGEKNGGTQRHRGESRIHAANLGSVSQLGGKARCTGGHDADKDRGARRACGSSQGGQKSRAVSGKTVIDTVDSPGDQRHQKTADGNASYGI